MTLAIAIGLGINSTLAYRPCRAAMVPIPAVIFLMACILIKYSFCKFDLRL